MCLIFNFYKFLNFDFFYKENKYEYMVCYNWCWNLNLTREHMTLISNPPVDGRGQN